MLKIQMAPDQDSYQIKENKSVLSVQLDGGQPRRRRDQLNMVVEVEIGFTCTPIEYQYLRAFYNVTGKGADSFLIDLILDEADLVEYVANFKPGTWRLSKVNGLTYEVRTTIEVQPNDGLDYAAIVDAYEPETYVAPPAPVNFGGE
jgi:hypothetical protein